METQSLILSNDLLAKGVYRMVLTSDISKSAKAGQFVQIRIPGFFLRRPISVSDSDPEKNTITIVYKVMGEGTAFMSTMEAGQSLNLVGPLGMGFPAVADASVLLLGGGVGTPPMLKTAKMLLEKGKRVEVVLGFNTRDEIFYTDAFEQIGITPVVATMDGSAGVKGTVLDAVKEYNIECDTVMACGPMPMLRAVANTYSKGYISLENRMACGIGVCQGCVVKDNKGEWLRVCANGPVFPIGKVVL